MKTPTTFKVTRQALAEVLPHVCSDYKDRINKLAQKDLFSNEIEVPENIVRLAHKEHTKFVHKEWLDKYLPLPKTKKIELKYCLQTTGIWLRGDYSSSLRKYTFEKLYEVSYECESLYVILATVKNNTANKVIFLGHWNDGIAED